MWASMKFFPKQLIEYKESPVFAIFVPVLTTLCMLGLKMIELFCTLL